ncbi:MAG: GNAT family N-acetyltransferase [Thermoanaerobaculia bacterium]
MSGESPRPGPPAALTFREAREGDLAALLPMMRALWGHEGIPFDERLVEPALRELLAAPALGRVWLALAGDAVAGYAMGTWGFSIEQGGRFLLLDELFVLPAFRGTGIGREALAFVERAALAAGGRAVRIEVAEENDGARRLYREAGYSDPRRLFLAKRLPPG